MTVFIHRIIFQIENGEIKSLDGEGLDSSAENSGDNGKW